MLSKIDRAVKMAPGDDHRGRAHVVSSHAAARICSGFVDCSSGQNRSLVHIRRHHRSQGNSRSLSNSNSVGIQNSAPEDDFSTGSRTIFFGLSFRQEVGNRRHHLPGPQHPNMHRRNLQIGRESSSMSL